MSDVFNACLYSFERLSGPVLSHLEANLYAVHQRTFEGNVDSQLEEEQLSGLQANLSKV